jgi:hypothetical protein
MVPMVPNIISNPECLASELPPNVLNLPVLVKLPSALFDIRLTRRVLLGPGQVLNNSDRVSSIFLKTRIGAPIRCSLRLPYQISPRIDSSVKPCFSNADSLLDPKARDKNLYKIFFLLLLLYMDFNHVYYWVNP